ncbi:MAG: 2-oxoacid:ferredoxin oxidoreductase subunit beta [Proteobacteria bacterium]|nr:2-oxoacid:ferredoxin oxidoreductase subunit beta [Pseudomonadota bacterium]MBU1387565.1 2-oxoacid:ferredoxin oxidoreductase subunit beta [Pseudomonadota bacterium]MBU1544040.1 2-oxoacid:ferredoxin oxidoreductase subunit beta [Pseudomonadota bacterium]MBU2431693.1 2-oxoacid:ferredoxin oxidoreductase subunit beta [Pseudomonadota bacterium]MBU2479636.1 2-oxoacid:ferredoxin oxidoreductase subunit beta [Pseudomonadota bacterium]
MKQKEFNFKDYIRNRYFPHIWCPGCGHGIVLGALLRAVHELGLEKNEIVVTSGIGCSSRISGYVDFHTLHTIHGRALAFATGVKLSKPSLKAIVPMGDGDALAIGGNHFIHAARRNIDITAIVMNNRIYGMTGGQFSPLSGSGKKATTAPYLTIDRAFDIVDLAKSAGATFVARSTVFHATESKDIIKKAITHKGFSVVEILTQCPTYYGRKNKEGDAIQMMEGFNTHTAKIGSKKLENNPNLIQRGIFVEDKTVPEYCEAYDQIIATAMKESL